jgi:hypothetical protein
MGAGRVESGRRQVHSCRSQEEQKDVFFCEFYAPAALLWPRYHSTVRFKPSAKSTVGL